MPAMELAELTKTTDDQLESWKLPIADHLDQLEADDDIAIWDDWGVVDALCRDSNEQELILSGLVRLMELSISGYLEVLEFATDARVSRLAEVVVRQRAAQCEELRGSIANGLPATLTTN